jgi:hypothetical protein
VGWLTYIKRKGTCAGLASRVENVIGQKFQIVAPQSDVAAATP